MRKSLRHLELKGCILNFDAIIAQTQLTRLEVYSFRRSGIVTAELAFQLLTRLPALENVTFHLIEGPNADISEVRNRFQLDNLLLTRPLVLGRILAPSLQELMISGHDRTPNRIWSSLYDLLYGSKTSIRRMKLDHVSDVGTRLLECLPLCSKPLPRH